MVKQLRNYIPLAGPATRCPCDGTETSFRASVGFTPRWFHDRLGIDFSEKWHQDPEYRYETLMEMRALLHQKFPQVEHFRPRVADGVDLQCATLDGVYSAMLISMIYGLKVHYFVDNWPSTSPADCYSKEYLSQLKPICLDENPAFCQLERQMDTIEKRWGRISGYLNYQGVLNNAFRLRGQEIFFDMCDDPDFVHFLMNHITETMIAVAKRVQERQRRSGFPIDLITNSNCVINMISADMYEEFVLPYDQRIAEEFSAFGIHTCNWNATPYIDKLAMLPKMGYIDMGMDTDMEKMRRVFPDARRGVLYSPVKCEEQPLEEIARDFRRIAKHLGPCDIILADLETTITDERVTELLQLADKISEEFDSGLLQAD